MKTRAVLEDLEYLYKTDDARIKTRVALLGSFQLYLEFMFFAVNESNIMIKPFHITIIAALERLVFNENDRRNLGLCIPVGSGKSLIVEYFISWCFAQSINNTFLYVSHSNTLINKLSKETQDIVTHPVWEAIFQKTLKKDDRSKINWSFFGASNRTGLTAGTMGGGITGLDAGNPNTSIDGFSGALIIDDPMDAGNIRHKTARDECVFFYDDKLTVRRRTPVTPTLLLAQRLDVADLVGWVKKHEPDDWEIIEIPALDKNGNSFWEERYPKKELESMRNTNPRKFNAQYQQTPSDQDEGIFKRKFLQEHYLSLPDYREFDAACLSWDMTFKDTSKSDFVVGQVWAKKGGNLFLLDEIRDRMDFNTTLDAFKAQVAKYPWIMAKLVEDKANGPAIISVLQNEILGIIAIEPNGSKEARASAISPLFRAGNVKLPARERAKWIDEYKEELIAFPASPDDRVDATSQALTFLTGGGGFNEIIW